MSFSIRELPKAQSDVRAIFLWLRDRSPIGAESWLVAYDSMLKRLEYHASACARAPEARACERDIRQTFFRTKHGQPYRALFLVEDQKIGRAHV